MQKFKLKHVVLNFKFGSLDKANREQGIFVMLDKGCKQEKEKKSRKVNTYFFSQVRYNWKRHVAHFQLFISSLNFDREL